jgi:transitional endoplasmic reticulum ATPase
MATKKNAGNSVGSDGGIDLATALASHLQAGAVLGQLQEALETRFFQSIEVTEGKTLTLPKGMSFDDGIKFLEAKRDADEQFVRLERAFDAYPFDAAHALVLVLNDLFNFSASSSQKMNTPWGIITYEPEFYTVETSPGVFVDVPWGEFSLPVIEGTIETDARKVKGGVQFVLKGHIKAKYKPVFQQIADLLDAKLKTHSIYRGKAIKMVFSDDPRDWFNMDYKPTYMKLDGPRDPVFNSSTEEAIDLSIITPIRYADRLKRNGMTGKRTVLLEGDYGVGKTLTALMVARECVEEGRTFLYIPNCRHLERGLQLARKYAPATVFTEDADIVLGGDRDEEMNRLSTVLDGVDNKDEDVMLILTTNKVESINSLMARPGRIDSVIHIGKPDLDTVYRLMVRAAGDSLDRTNYEKSDFLEVLKPMEGLNPAFMSEVVNKAKLRSLKSFDHSLIGPDDIRVAVEMIASHVRLMDAIAPPQAGEVLLSDLTVRFGPDQMAAMGVGNGHLTPALVK